VGRTTFRWISRRRRRDATVVRRAFNRCALINSTILGARVDDPTSRRSLHSTCGQPGVDDGRMSPSRRLAALQRHGPDDSATVSLVVLDDESTTTLPQ